MSKKEQSILDTLKAEYAELYAVHDYDFSEQRIKELQNADAETLEKETIKLLLYIYQNAMNNAAMIVKIIESGDTNGKTKEALTGLYSEANKSMANMINLIKSKKTIDMNKIEEEPVLEENEVLKIGQEEFNRILEIKDAQG